MGLIYRSLNRSNIKAQILIRMIMIAINDPEEMPASVIVRVAGLSADADIARDSDPIKHLLLQKYFLKLSKYFIVIANDISADED